MTYSDLIRQDIGGHLERPLQRGAGDSPPIHHCSASWESSVPWKGYIIVYHIIFIV